jgi:pectin methylesterase-like acyl-CoA thioesterase
MSRSTVLLAFFWMGCGAPGAADVEEAPLAEGARILSPGCAGSPYATIQSAINAAVNNDVIKICAGTYNERLTVSGKRLTIATQSGQRDVTIDAQVWGIGLAITGNATVTVRNLTIVNGTAANAGGNISCDGARMNVQNTTLSGGTAGFGGALSGI